MKYYDPEMLDQFCDNHVRAMTEGWDEDDRRVAAFGIPAAIGIMLAACAVGFILTNRNPAKASPAPTQKIAVQPTFNFGAAASGQLYQSR